MIYIMPNNMLTLDWISISQALYFPEYCLMLIE